MSAGILVPERKLVQWGFGLNLAWELAQTPLYADSGRGLSYLAWTRLHCTVGDVLILLAAFWLTAGLHRSRHWYLDSIFLGGAAFSGIGLAYTTWSEWVNTSIRSSWTYQPEMPTIVGIGIAPLLQWILIPPVIVALLRRDRETARPNREVTTP